jgi:hypothetical protein
VRGRDVAANLSISESLNYGILSFVLYPMYKVSQQREAASIISSMV